MTPTETAAADIIKLFDQHAQPAPSAPAISTGDITSQDGPIIIGGNLYAYEEPQIHPDHPNALKCPHCGRITGRDSETCRCNYRVKAHFDAIDQQERNEKITNWAFYSLTFGAASLFLVAHFGALMSYWTYIPVIGIASGMLAIQAVQQGRQ